MKKSIWLFSLSAVLVVGSGAGIVYGYWTDRIEARVTMTVVHPAEISLVEETEVKADDEEVPIPATASDVGAVR